ncbi:MAG: hypothetical protein Q8N94_08995 [Methanoregula sp.]|nr:hypothetical protein [Methanoregula sp.]
MQNLSAEGSRRIGEEIETIEMAIGFQRIAMQNTDEMEILPGLLPCDDIPLPHEETTGTSAHKAGGKPEHRHQPPSRKRALVMQEIPLSMLPAALQRGVKEKHGKMHSVVIVRSHWNHYTIKIRCSTKKAAEHCNQSQHTDQLPHTDELQTTVQLQNKVQSRNTDHTNTTGSLKCGDGT